MKLKTVLRLLTSGKSLVTMQLFRASDGFYRLSFVGAALTGGLLDALRAGPADQAEIARRLGLAEGGDGLAALLGLGVSLGELERGPRGYSLQGRLSRDLAGPDNDELRAMVEEMVVHHHHYILKTPAMLKEGREFEFDESAGELIARASRFSEPFIVEALDDFIPASGAARLLEIGCGSGAYIRYACGRNPSLTAVGLELQPEVARFARRNLTQWGLADRAPVEACDVRAYEPGQRFDLATLHQNIYYFEPERRVELLRKIHGLLEPRGKLLVTSACKGGGPAFQALDVWLSMSKGLAPLPDPDQLRDQLYRAGFERVTATRLVPRESFYALAAEKG